MYRKRKNGSRKFNERNERARFTRIQNRLNLPAIEYPAEIRELRRKIIVEDFDFGETVTHEILLYRTNRIDCYRVVIDGNEVSARLGWSKILEKLRKGFPRICRACF